MDIRLGGIIRDVIIIYALITFASFLSIVAGLSIQNMLVYYALKIMPPIVGFTISGCISKQNRFRHLLFVAFAYLITTSVLVFLVNRSLNERLYNIALNIVSILISMPIGGGLSFIFVKTPVTTRTELNLEKTGIEQKH